MINPFEDFGDSGKKKRMLIPGSSLASTALAMKDGKRTTWEAFGIKKKMTAVFSKTLDWSKAVLTRMGGKLLEAWEWIKNPENIKNVTKGIGDRIAGWAKKLAEKAANAGKFLGDWLKDDPVGAVAGILGIGLAAGLTAGLVVGGVALVKGSLAGGLFLKGLWGAMTGAKVAFFTGATLVGMTVWVVQKAQEIWHFDWNVTDEDLFEEVENAWKSIYGVLGDITGNVLGQACGGLAAGATVWVNPQMMLAMKQYVGEQAYEVAMESLGTLLGWSRNLFQKWLFAHAFSKGRKLVKWIVRRVPFVSDLLGEQKTKAILETWGEKGAKPWTFAQAFERKLETIENENVRTFAENAAESFFERCGDSLISWSVATAW